MLYLFKFIYVVKNPSLSKLAIKSSLLSHSSPTPVTVPMGTLWLSSLMFLVLLVHPLYIGIRCTNHFSSSSLLTCQPLLFVEGRGGSQRGWAHLQAPGSLASSWSVVISHYWFLIVDRSKSTDFLAKSMATFSHFVLFLVNRGTGHDYLQRVLDENTAQGKCWLYFSHTRMGLSPVRP